VILGIVSEEGPSWSKFNTRSGTRFVNEITFTDDGVVVPECFSDISAEVVVVVTELCNVAKLSIADGSALIPLQVYLCFYRDGSDLCPMHSHKCRQITLSIGADRIMTVGTTKTTLYNGSVIYLHTEKHGILKDGSGSGNRVSFNLFYTTTSEMQGVQ
jgi:hypothetical protein